MSKIQKSAATVISREPLNKRKSALRGFPVAGAVAMILASAVVTAADAARGYHFDLSSQTLSQALRTYGQISGQEIIFTEDLVTGLTAAPLQGDFTAQAALDQLLSGTGLTSERSPSGALMIRRSATRSSLNESGESAFRLAQADAGQSAAQADASSLEEVVVLGAKRKFAPTDSNAATKIPMDVIDTPQAISVLSSELMNIVGVNSIHTAAALAPSVLDQEGETPVFIDTVARGFEVDFWNGNKINGMPFLNGGGLIDFGIVDRLDVVRGPASIIYGQSDYGATLNITLKGPQAKRQVSGEIGTSSNGGHRALLDITGALTASENLRGRLIVVDDDTQSGQDYAFMNGKTVSAALSWDLREETTLDVNFFHNEREGRRNYGFGLAADIIGTDPDSGDPIYGNFRLPDISRKAFIGADYGINSGTMDFGIAKLTHRFNSDWALTATGATHHTSFTWLEPFTFGYITPQNGGNLELVDYWSDQESYDDSADLTLTGDFHALGQTHTLVLSGYRRLNKVNFFSACCHSLGTINVFDPKPASYDQFYTVPTDPENDTFDTTDLFADHERKVERGISALLLLHPVNRLTAMLGVRYTDYKSAIVDYYNRSVSYQDPAQYKNDATTKRIGLVYEVLPDVNVYASWSDGNIFHANQNASGNVLPPETGEQWEFGAKAGLLDRKLTVSAAAFKIDRKNLAIHDPAFANNLPFSITVDGQVHKGIELEAIGEPIPGWNIISSYSYLDVTRGEHQVANAPHHLAKLYTTYQLQEGTLRGLSLGGGAFHVGKREVDDIGTFRFPAYTRLDLRLGYDRLENVSFSINAINLTDKKIYTSAANRAEEAIEYQSRRSILFRTSFKF